MNTDPFQLKEDAAVAWLAFKPSLGILLGKNNEDEELLRLVFFKAFGDGWAKGAHVAMDETSKRIQRVTQ